MKKKTDKTVDVDVLQLVRDINRAALARGEKSPIPDLFMKQAIRNVERDVNQANRRFWSVVGFVGGGLGTWALLDAYPAVMIFTTPMALGYFGWQIAKWFRSGK